MAGFAVSINGWIWVSTEAQGVRIPFRVTRRVRPKIEGDVNSTVRVHAPTLRLPLKMGHFRSVFVAVSG
jgi:hypothetical protein